MPLAQKLTKKKAKKKLPIQGPDINRKGHNTAVAGGSGKAGTLITPKIDVTKITKDKEFQEQLYSLIDDIEITEDDVPDEMLEDWYDLQDELKPTLVKKNWLLWATLFSAVVLPGIVQGTRSEPTVKQPAVIIKGKQQEPIPPLEPRQIVNYSQEYFKEHGLELCKSLTETDLTRLKGDLIQNWNKGEDAFAKAFKESYPVSKQRLETIYRSERHMAEYYGVMKRAERAGHSYKQWRAVGDERTCDECMQYDMEIVPIGEPFSNGAMTANAHVNCYSSDTEVFTENGWKLFKDVDPSEKIWTFNLQSRMMELDTQKSQISYPYNGNMIHLKNKSLDCLVTPDHNMIVKSAWNFLNRPESSFVFKKASELSNSDRIPVTSEWQGKNIATIDINGHKFPADKFMSFMGWYISEGSICKPKKTDWQIHITQTKPENKQEIYDLCKSLFPVVYNCIDYICIAHVGDIKNYFIRLGHSHEKYIPNKLKNLSQDLLKHFFDSYIKGNGSISNNKWNGYEQYNYGHSITASTNSIKLINDLTEIGMKLGYSISYSIRHPKPIFFKRNNKTYTAKYDQHVIRFNKHKNRCFYKHIMKEIPYNDMVYCLEMEHNHSLFVRRNNKTNWSGNCRCSMVSLTDDEFDEMPDEQFSDENLPDNDEEWDEEMKQDAAYLDNVAEFMKLNYNCPKEEKSGEGPGSCGGKESSNKEMIIKSEKTDNRQGLWYELANKILSKKDAEKYTTGLYGPNSDRVIAGLKTKLSEELNKKGYSGIKIEHTMDKDFDRSISLDPAHTKQETATDILIKTRPRPTETRTEAKFVPAKDIKSAETFAESLLDPNEVARVKRWNSGETAHTTPDKVQQIKMISFRGIDINIANAINKQIVKNNNMGLPLLKSIVSTQNKNSPNILMSIGGGHLKLNTISIGKPDRIERQLNAARKLHGKEGKEILAILESKRDIMTPAQQKQYDDIKEVMKYSRGGIGYEEDSTPERAIEATINHEMAHALLHSSGIDKYEDSDFRKDVNEMTKLTLNSEYKYKLSEYGCNPKGPMKMLNPEETWAELYAAYRFHEDENIHPDALKLMKKWLDR